MSFPKFHINPETGKPGICVAKFNCRFGGPAVHFPSEDDARMAYERRMEREEWRKHPLPPGDVQHLPSTYPIDAHSFTLPPGEYFLGDPYLTIGTKDQAGWNHLVEMMDHDFGLERVQEDPTQHSRSAYGALYNDEPVLMLSSFHGAGLHWSVGPIRRIPSDTGLVGFTPKNVIESMGYTLEEAEAAKLGMKVTIEDETVAWRDEVGIIVLGGKLVLSHSKLLQDKFQSMAEGDGVVNAVATSETYATLQQRGTLWKDDITSFHQKMEARANTHR